MHTDSYAIVVNNNHTDIVLNAYINRIFLIISQYKKLGSLVTIHKDSSVRDSNVYETKVLFGKDDPEIHAASRFIAEQINMDKPLLISLCLKDFQVTTLRTIVKSIINRINH